MIKKCNLHGLDFATTRSMYKVEKKEYGYKLIFSGTLLKSEMEDWVSESHLLLKDQQGEFGVLVDMTKAKPIDEETRHVMAQGQKLYKSKGMKRSSVVLSNTIATLQFKQIARKSGIYEFERYIDSSIVKNWEEVGLKWLIDAVDPDESF